MEELSIDKKSGKKVVGIMTGSFHTDYSRTITQTICKELSDLDVEVRLFQALDASRFLKVDNYIDDGFDLHYYSIFEYSKFMKIDLLIISCGTISAISNPISVTELISYLPKVPIILLEDDLDVENGIHITLDNYQGMKSCVEHLIHEHNKRQILYVSGPEEVTDSRDRLRAYRDTMKEAGIAVSEDMIAWGDFTDHVDAVVKELFVRYPDADAVVCANDEMAESAYRVLESMGKKPGIDIAVTGFDDTVFAVYMSPSLTTVRQDFNLMAKKVAGKVYDFFSGKKVTSESIKPKLILRASCGCTGADEVITDEKRALDQSHAMMDRMRIKRLENDNMLSALLFRNILTEYVKIDTFFENLGKQFIRLGCSFSTIYLLKEPIRVRSQKKMFLPNELFLYMRQVGEEIITFHPDSISKAGWNDLEYPGEVHKNLITAVFPLFYGDLHYGMLWAEVNSLSTLFYYTLSLEIGSGLRYLYMALDQQAAHAALEEKSIVLDHFASHDEMTGCFNRVGIIENLSTFMRIYDEKDNFVAVMADLDHLKQINDTFGHAEGDEAIKTAADAIKNSMPDANLLGRTGGDEFTAVFHIEREDEIPHFMEKIKKNCDSYNEVSGRPYYVNISVGCVEFAYKDRGRFSELLKIADKNLYEAKKRRKKNVLRNC